MEYGTEYQKEQIDEALRSENPLEIVPVTDPLGHGTFMAGIAAGNEMPEEDFTGVAPLSQIVVVKLKEAKESLKAYYGIGVDKKAYQENDIMLGVHYLQLVAQKKNMSLVVFVGMGTNAGNHSGELSLARFMGQSAIIPGNAYVTSAGNEGNREHHYQRKYLETGASDTIEFNISEGEAGITIELWTSAPQLFTVEVQSPWGNTTGRLPIWYGKTMAPITFPLENSRIFVEYTVVETYTGNEVIVIRILKPTPGIWRLKVVNETEYQGGFNVWMPINNFLDTETRFLNPEPEITICEPGNSPNILTATAYNHVDDSIYINASRGYSSTMIVKPDLAAPGVNVYGPMPGGGFGGRSGTSIAAAFCAGSAALLLEWGVVRRNSIGMQTTEIMNILKRGADREGMEYPNPVWGYGKLNVYKAFRQLRPL